MVQKRKLAMKTLLIAARQLRAAHWTIQRTKQIDLIPSNDFSFYDNMLDTAVLLNTVPERYRSLNLSPLETYFAMAPRVSGKYR